MIAVNCPHCNEELAFPESLAGKKEACSACNKPVTVRRTPAPPALPDLKELAEGPTIPSDRPLRSVEDGRTTVALANRPRTLGVAAVLQVFGVLTIIGGVFWAVIAASEGLVVAVPVIIAAGFLGGLLLIAAGAIVGHLARSAMHLGNLEALAAAQASDRLAVIRRAFIGLALTASLVACAGGCSDKKPVAGPPGFRGIAWMADLSQDGNFQAVRAEGPMASYRRLNDSPQIPGVEVQGVQYQAFEGRFCAVVIETGEHDGAAMTRVFMDAYGPPKSGDGRRGLWLIGDVEISTGPFLTGLSYLPQAKKGSAYQKAKRAEAGKQLLD